MVRCVQFDILVVNHVRRVLRAKEEGPSSVYQFSSKASISDGTGCISAYGMGSLHVLESTMNAEMYKGFRATYAPLQMTCISGKALCISAGQCKTTWIHSGRARVLNWLPAVRSFTYREHLAHH